MMRYFIVCYFFSQVGNNYGHGSVQFKQGSYPSLMQIKSTANLDMLGIIITNIIELNETDYNSFNAI